VTTTPATRYAHTADGLSIAYQTLGDGPIDVVLLRMWHTNLEHDWDERVIRHLFTRVANFGRLILFDRRGTGLSDPVGDRFPELDQRVDDLTAVLDATSSASAALVSIGGGAAEFCCFFAATHPDRVSHLVMYNPQVCGHRAADYPWGASEAEIAAEIEDVTRAWGEAEANAETLRTVAPSRASDSAFARWWSASQRRSASPRAARMLLTMEAATDVRETLPAIAAHTLIVRRGPLKPAAEAEWIAAHIGGAELVDLPGPDHMMLSGDTDSVIDVIERFLTGTVRTAPVLDRALATLMFTDIVASTERMAELGDSGWVDVIASHHAATRRALETYRGREIDTAGDGFFATFDGPARAVRCAQEIVTATADLGLEVRAGLHSGECEIADGKPTGLSVVVAARVMAEAQPGTVLVTSTVRDLTAGAGIEYSDAGRRELKGLPDDWQLYATASP
jgi:class 3 adenylate cyclase